ncbi:hypothetical protein [Zavarzinella formosa]|uniref:hypothetical protein n=1 Tax=Zavarzinella formosa TaxID=360055 RepID=UPI00031B51AE|nr:hypothetical protein [Zavarzinella formosa]
MNALRVWLACLIVMATGVAHAQDKSLLRPDPNWKGMLIEFLYPKEWLAYYPTAKVGDFVVYSGKFGDKREEVVAVTPDYVVVSRTFSLRKDSVTELRTQYKLSDDDKKKLAQGIQPPAAKTKTPTKGKTTTKGKPAAKEEETSDTVKVGDKELKCEIKKTGKTTTWHSSELPFDGIVKKESTGESFTVSSFGRGK